MALIIADVTDSERPRFELSRRCKYTVGTSNVTGTITDTIAVAVDGTAILVDEASLVGALFFVAREKKNRERGKDKNGG